MDVQGVDDFDGASFSSMQQMEQQTSPKLQNKPLKFVTNYGAPHPKRRRIAAACLTCRKRKTACSGERPTCETCSQNGLECAGYAADAPAPRHKRTASEANVHETVNGTNEADDRPRKAPQPYHQAQTEPEPDHDQARPSTNGQAPAAPALPAWPSYEANTSNANHQRPNSNERDSVRRASEAATDGAPTEESLFSGPRNRMPYFRWLGPTAVVPGLKQVVVKVKRQDANINRSSSDGTAGAGNVRSPSIKSLNANGTDPLTGAENGSKSPLALPFYDTSPMPPSELITHLANTFFIHLGCNYPFLQRERFMRDLEEKHVDAILVDAVCALAARFSTHALLTQQTNADESETAPAEYGHAFAQRAQTALVDTFFCPTVAAVQATLLLAYNEFGENRDSGLWMYLGISIRMAQDLGLDKIEGLKYRGQNGPTPKMIKKESMNGAPEMASKLASSKKEKDDELERLAKEKARCEKAERMVDVRDQADAEEEVAEQKAVEQERVDTFWGLFFLDRVVSCGTGRISTIRDKDIELSFPALDETDSKSGWPAPYPALIRIVHLYGRVADLLNSIKEPSDITSETPRRLASMERQVTNFYQGLSPRLHFDAVNFQHYMKAGEGTNFVLLHFWFHTLIVLLHQPTLLKTFEGRMLQLFPNSQQLSMSSAKTIADILSYSQLMDAKASLGNPFTAQPIYIAACAFLRETIEQTATSNNQSRESSPSRKNEENKKSEKNSSSEDRTEERSGRQEERAPSTHASPSARRGLSIAELSNNSYAHHSPTGRDSFSSMTAERHESSDKSRQSGLSGLHTANTLARHTLLATAASQHYQLCYKALESIHAYWAGAKSMLTVLDQKFEGVRDPLLYTEEEGESAMEQPRAEPAFTSPGWRRKLTWAPYIYGPNVQRAEFWREKAGQIPGSPSDPSKAIGWTLTGTMNSPNTNLAWHYPSTASASPQYELPQRPQSQRQSTSPNATNSLPIGTNFTPSVQHVQQQPSQTTTSTSNAQSMSAPPMTSHPARAVSSSSSNQNAIAISNSSATYMSGIDQQYRNNDNANPSRDTSSMYPSGPQDMSESHSQQHHAYPSAGPANDSNDALNNWNYDSGWNSESLGMQPFGDMMIESQDIDMNLLGLDMMPWFDPAYEYSGFFDGAANQSSPVDSASGRQRQ